ncbi:MAG: hypothetical protein WC792_04095 [Candidatus Micrarchaeia archaeon]|jgi:hypothetical protein
MVKLQETKAWQFTVTIPRNIAAALGWIKGHELKLTVEGKGQLGLTA